VVADYQEAEYLVQVAAAELRVKQQVQISAAMAAPGLYLGQQHTAQVVGVDADTIIEIQHFRLGVASHQDLAFQVQVMAAEIQQQLDQAKEIQAAEAVVADHPVKLLSVAEHLM
jgi:hypothetical protein